MGMTDLSRDMLENILSRLPVESLRELRFTCKLWNTLFKDRRFIKNRFHKAAMEVIVLMRSSVSTLIVDMTHMSEGSNYAGIGFHILNGGISNFYSNEITISGMFHCDGLLLLQTMKTDTNKLVVWNPCSKGTRWIELMNHDRSGIFALGYHNDLCDSYKVLSILDYDPKPEVHIYEINSDSWRPLDDDVPLGCMIKSRGVSLLGNTYWIASQVKELLLLSFDFTTETFGCLNLPLERLGFKSLGLSVVKDEQLAILQQCLDTSRVEIWVATNDKIDQTKVLSWTKLLAVDLDTCYEEHKFTCDVSFFIDEEKTVAVCWDRESLHIFGEDHPHEYIPCGDSSQLHPRE
ncbi:hypothetical protein CARUB_v10025179mg, partial [Capsella rubella]